MKTFDIVSPVFEFRSPKVNLSKAEPMKSSVAFRARLPDGEEVELLISGHVLANMRLALDSVAREFPSILGGAESDGSNVH